MRGKTHDCVGVCACDSDVWWPLLPEALLGAAVGLELPRMRH